MRKVTVGVLLALSLAGCAAEPTNPAPIPIVTTPSPSLIPEPSLSPEVYYANCAEVRQAKKAPLKREQPGYRKGLDRDGDGIACD